MYFYDSYALIEIIKGNSEFDKYSDFIFICIDQNLFEVHYSLLRLFDKKTADYWIKKFNYNILPIDKEDIIEASDFRFKFKERRFSMTDCIGYVIAKKHKLKFLTGDRQFKDLPNVKFVR